MSTGDRKPAPSFSERARDLGINVLVFSGAQVLAALLAWQLIFRSHPQGLAMGLSLVGFASWGIGFLASFRRPLRPVFGSAAVRPAPDTQSVKPPTRGNLQTQLGTAGCGTVLFLSGLIVLGLAFVLRVRADMQTGLTWSDIFPTQP